MEAVLRAYQRRRSASRSWSRPRFRPHSRRGFVSEEEAGLPEVIPSEVLAAQAEGFAQPYPMLQLTPLLLLRSCQGTKEQIMLELVLKTQTATANLTNKELTWSIVCKIGSIFFFPDCWLCGLLQMENGRERQVGGETCRTMHKNDFKKDSPKPCFSLFFGLTPRHGQYF